MESSLIPSFLKKKKKKRKKKDITSSLIHKKASPYLLKFYQEIPAIHTLLQAPCLILAFLLFPSHRQLLPSLKSRTPQSHSGRWEIFFQTPVYVDIFTSSHESQIFLMTTRIVNPFHKVFNLLFRDPPEKSLFMAALSFQNVLNNKT